MQLQVFEIETFCWKIEEEKKSYYKIRVTICEIFRKFSFELQCKYRFNAVNRNMSHG